MISEERKMFFVECVRTGKDPWDYDCSFTFEEEDYYNQLLEYKRLKPDGVVILTDSYTNP